LAAGAAAAADTTGATLTGLAPLVLAAIGLFGLLAPDTTNAGAAAALADAEGCAAAVSAAACAGAAAAAVDEAALTPPVRTSLQTCSVKR
jgi:uncharacterized protein YgiB involved in biofilm formation